MYKCIQVCVQVSIYIASFPNRPAIMFFDLFVGVDGMVIHLVKSAPPPPAPGICNIELLYMHFSVLHFFTHVSIQVYSMHVHVLELPWCASNRMQLLHACACT